MTASLVITIDTEPDNQWAIPSPDRPAGPLEFANTRGARRLIDFLDGQGTPGTWLTSYAVARDTGSVQTLREAAARGHEIGGHLHGWETPPFTPADRVAHPYIYEYEPAVRLEKLRAVTLAIEDAFGRRPVSYRAGRWGIDETERVHLAALGYAIDSSVVPGHSFATSIGLSRGGPDFRAALDGGPPEPYRCGGLWEVPVSATTIGLLPAAGARGLSARLARSLSYRSGVTARAARRALAAGVCRLVWVRPLVHPRRDLVRAALSLVEQGASLINVMFHSSEAFEGTSPRTRRREDVERFYGDLAEVLGALRDTGKVVPATLSAAMRGRKAPA